MVLSKQFSRQREILEIREQELKLLQLLGIKRTRQLKRIKKRKHRFWVREIYERRSTLGVFSTLFQELKTDREQFFRYTQMSPDRFHHLLGLVEEKISKKDTQFRKTIFAEERLIITVRYLATGETQQSLSFAYRMGRTTVSNIVTETSKAIFEALAETYLAPPKSSTDWEKIAEQFEERWNFPRVLRALDGKHIRLECPKFSGSLYHNYKGYFSSVLLALCDANYCFTMIDYGEYGSNNDAGIVLRSEIKKIFEEATTLPEPVELEGCHFNPLPFFLLGMKSFR